MLGLQCVLVDGDLGDVSALAGKHKLLREHVNLGHLLLCLLLLLELLDSVRVPEGVECMLAARVGR